MSTPATQDDLKFFLTLFMLIARDFGIIDSSQFGAWHISLDNSGELEKKNLWGATGSKGNAHFILINPKLTEYELLYTVAHEVVHIMQFMKGDAQNSDGINQINWKGQDYEILPGDSPDYEDQPWEEEAYQLGPKILEDIKRILMMDIIPVWRQFNASEWSLNLISDFKNNLLK